VKTWVDGVNELYNRPNAEPYQLAICLAFGGIFGPLMPSAQWRGIAKLRGTSEENKSTPDDLFAHLMSDMNGKLLVTNRYDGSDRRSATTVEMDQAQIRGVVEGRVIIGTEDERPRVYVSLRAVIAWW
jgi:hypothetical protein